MNFIFQYPDFNGADGDMLQSGSIGELAIAAERAGFDGFAFTEHPAPGARWLAHGGHQSLDPFVALGGAATVTTRLRLLTYLAVLPYRNPLLLAKAATTVDRLSQGRLILGVGAGYLKGEFAALGVDFAERNALFDETLDALPLHWSGEPFSYEGKHWTAREVQALPRPVQQPIPIWIGGNARITRQRVARRCQGWMPLTGPDEMFATTRTPAPGGHDQIAAHIAEIKAEAAAAGRDVVLDFALAYGDRSIEDPRDEADRHREAFGRLEQAGATWLAVSCHTAPRERVLDFIEAFGEAYLDR